MTARRPTKERDPRTLGQLMTWFLAAWSEEAPMRLHVRGVWHDKTGGSVLGAPELAGDMRRILEGSPHATDYDPKLDLWEGEAALRTPMRSALSTLARTSPFMSRYLWAAGCAGGWKPIEAWVPEHYREAFAHEALRRLWRIHEQQEENVA